MLIFVGGLVIMAYAIIINITGWSLWQQKKQKNYLWKK
jgi:uncharacterized membrane protein (DUF2068 family)